MLVRKAWLLLALVGCATDDEPVDQYDDVDGSGKGDGATSSDPNRLLDIPFYFAVPKTAVTTPLDRALSISDAVEQVLARRRGRPARDRSAADEHERLREAGHAAKWRASSPRRACSRTATSC
jgi:hypothetical protein